MTPENVSTYSYNNSFMKDVITHYTSTDGNIDSDVLFDDVGNITYFNGQTYTWNANRQLEAVTTEDGLLYRYYYNENGFLTRLDTYDNNDTVCNGSMSYIWNGDTLVSRTFADYEANETIVSRVVYDSEGEAVGTVVSKTVSQEVVAEQFVFYRKNLQGDITGVIDSVTGQLVASYTYDAYGNISAQPINDNQFSVIGSVLMLMALPQAYRGYTFSFVGEELCYYLGSRFYSPRLGRFINADKHFDTGTGVLGTNVFAYCNNNPVMHTDPTGEALRIISKLLNVIVKVITAIKKVFIKEVSYGAAKPFTGDKRPNVNCYAYAIGVDEARNPNNNPNITDFSLGNIIRLVELDFKTKLKPRKIRQLKNIDSKIESDEYRIALRTGSHTVNGRLEKDYHFMVQHDDGSWSHKPGLLEARKLKTGETPETASWDLYEFVNNKVSVAYVNFYDSKTVYFAVTW